MNHTEIADIIARGEDHVAQVAGELMRSLGEVMDVDRVYVFRYDDASTVSQLEEWVAPGIEPQLDNPDLQGLDMEAAGFGRWLPTLRRGEIISGPVASFPESEQPLLAAQDIQSLIVVPIERDAEPWGFVGFDDCKGEQTWSKADQEALRGAAKLLGETLDSVTRAPP